VSFAISDIHARAEGGALAGEDGHAQLVVLVELVPGVIEAAHHLAVDGVALLGTVQGNDEDMSVLLDDDGGLGHFGAPIMRTGASRWSTSQTAQG
jgi:hypothetical protein